MTRRDWLLAAAFLDFLAAALHVAVIVGGPEWYRFFGAGEEFALRDAAGDPLPALVTLAIALVLASWGLAALQSAGILLPVRIPRPEAILILVTLVYGIRSLAPLAAWAWAPEELTPFLLWSSAVCAAYAFCHAAGIRRPPPPDSAH